MAASRRAFLKTGGLASGALALRGLPERVLHAFQTNPVDARRAQTTAAAIETTKLSDRLRLLSGPGGNVLVLDGPVVFFPKANVLHMGDVFFNGVYPFIDASTGGTIDGVIGAVDTALEQRVTAATKIIPGHGPLGTRGSLDAYGRMLTTIRDRVRAAKRAGKSLAEVQAAKPTADFDEAWGKGFMTAGDFVGIVYNTTR